MTRRVLFHVQHLLGVGHVKRAATLAATMRQEALEVVVAFGGKPLPEAPFRDVEVVQLPPATIAGEDFSVLLDETGRPVDEAWKAGRAAALRALFDRVDPDALLLELFPFGRRQFRFELLPLLDRARNAEPRTRIASSVRDILVAAKRPGRDNETVELVRRHFDAVLVHGDPTVVPFEATFAAAGRIADLIRYTGYVCDRSAPAEATDGQGEVLVSAGGGAVGAALVLAAMAARPATPLADRTWRLIAGPNCPDAEFARLAAAARPGTIVERFRDDFPARLRTAVLSISQAGYNTAMDVLGAGVPAVLVPYEAKGETEQRLRAEILAQRGLAAMVPAAELSPETLARAVAEALARPRPPASGIDFSGAETTAALVGELAAARRRG